MPYFFLKWITLSFRGSTFIEIQIVKLVVFLGVISSEYARCVGLYCIIQVSNESTAKLENENTPIIIIIMIINFYGRDLTIEMTLIKIFNEESD